MTLMKQLKDWEEKSDILKGSCKEIGYSKLYREDIPLPNGKKFVQVDFIKM